jgi:hypothetical protein
MEEQTRNLKMVYTVVERSPGKSFWTRVGIGSVNRDGSLNLRLDAIPVNGTLQVRDWEPSERRSDADAGAPAAPRQRSQPRSANDGPGMVRPGDGFGSARPGDSLGG